MTNKTKQLIIAALMCSINPIIAVSTMELIGQFEVITTNICDTRSKLRQESNQEKRNGLWDELKKQNQEYEKIAIAIANQYETEKLEVKSIEYKAHALIAVAEIARIEAILAKENTKASLRKDLSKKYQEAAEALQSAADCASDDASKTQLLDKAGEAFRWAAGYESDKAKKTRLFNKAGEAFRSAAGYESDKAKKTRLLVNACDVFEWAKLYSSDKAIKTRLSNKAREVKMELAAVEQARADAEEKARAAEKARADAEEKTRVEAAAEKARADAAAAKKAWRNQAKYLFILIIAVLIVAYILAFHPAILSTALVYSKSLALLLLNSF